MVNKKEERLDDTHLAAFTKLFLIGTTLLLAVVLIIAIAFSLSYLL